MIYKKQRALFFILSLTANQLQSMQYFPLEKLPPNVMHEIGLFLKQKDTETNESIEEAGKRIISLKKSDRQTIAVRDGAIAIRMQADPEPIKKNLLINLKNVIFGDNEEVEQDDIFEVIKKNSNGEEKVLAQCLYPATKQKNKKGSPVQQVMLKSSANKRFILVLHEKFNDHFHIVDCKKQTNQMVTNDDLYNNAVSSNTFVNIAESAISSGGKILAVRIEDDLDSLGFLSTIYLFEPKTESNGYKPIKNGIIRYQHTSSPIEIHFDNQAHTLIIFNGEKQKITKSYDLSKYVPITEKQKIDYPAITNEDKETTSRPNALQDYFRMLGVCKKFPQSAEKK